MKLGLLADIHEHTRRLQKAIDVLRGHGAERFVVLGDVFEAGKRIEQTVRLLREVEAMGVWGNHDVGLCLDPSDSACEQYSAGVIQFMGSLQPHLVIADSLFTHAEPWLDPHEVEAAWHSHEPPDTREKLSRSFTAVPHRVLFMGHLHRWLAGTPDGAVAWRGDEPLCLERGNRYLVVIHAVCDGHCALFDTTTDELTPLQAL
jgi:predicted phosphodiesterase